VIHDALDRLPGDIAMLIIEHDMDVVFRFAREIVVLVRGRVLTRGTPAEISQNPEVRAVYLGKTAHASRIRMIPTSASDEGAAR
jgi:branched-chain amino acid transport system ATP-binding protein